MSSSDAAQKFDPARAGEYQTQSRIALAGYDACHELAASILAATVGPGTAAHILVVGAGGGAELCRDLGDAVIRRRSVLACR